ncbi:hypothetical protein ACHAP5_008073 [Fusarium lateritium]
MSSFPPNTGALFPFLKLPHELRHKVYEHYFTVNDGYSFDPGTGKLTASTGKPLDLALMYTCSFIASETKNLPLKHNVVSFSTVYDPKWRQWAARFDYLLRAQHLMQLQVLVGLGQHLTPDIYSQIRKRFPWFVPRLEYIVRHKEVSMLWNESYVDVVVRLRHWSLSNTIYRLNAKVEGVRGSRYEITQAVKFSLRLVAQKLGHGSLSVLDPSGKGPLGHGRLLDFLDECYEPWDIPSQSNLERMGRMFRDHKYWARLQGWEKPDDWASPSDNSAFRSKFRFSAAAVAIRFLNSLPSEKRLSLQSIVLSEDHVAVGYQDCHSHGLISFLRENPRLRIEIRASMLTNILLAGNIKTCAQHFQVAIKEDGPFFDTYNASAFVSYWLTEALATVDAGMPAKRYSLVLDGKHAMDLCSVVFQEVVQRDAAFFVAVETCFPSFLDQHDFASFPRRFAESLVHLVRQTSVMRCNFNPGVSHNVDKFIESLSGYRVDTHLNMSRLYQHFRNFDYPGLDRAGFPEALLNWEGLMLDNYESIQFPKRRRHRRANRHNRGVWRQN